MHHALTGRGAWCMGRQELSWERTHSAGVALCGPNACAPRAASAASATARERGYPQMPAEADLAGVAPCTLTAGRHAVSWPRALRDRGSATRGR